MSLPGADDGPVVPGVVACSRLEGHESETQRS